MSAGTARRTLLAALGGAVLCLAARTARAGDALQPQPGQALALDRMGVAGAPLRTALAAARGRPVVLHFWGTWCEPCREEIPALSRYAQDQADARLAFITVAVRDQSEAVETFLREAGAVLPVLHDGDQALIHALGVYVMPTTLVLDARHRVRWRSVGALDWDDATVRNTIAALLPASRPSQAPARGRS